MGIHGWRGHGFADPRCRRNRLCGLERLGAPRPERRDRPATVGACRGRLEAGDWGGWHALLRVRRRSRPCVPGEQWPRGESLAEVPGGRTEYQACEATAASASRHLPARRQGTDRMDNTRGPAIERRTGASGLAGLARGHQPVRRRTGERAAPLSAAATEKAGFGPMPPCAGTWAAQTACPARPGPTLKRGDSGPGARRRSPPRPVHSRPGRASEASRPPRSR